MSHDWTSDLRRRLDSDLAIDRALSALATTVFPPRDEADRNIVNAAVRIRRCLRLGVFDDYQSHEITKSIRAAVRAVQRRAAKRQVFAAGLMLPHQREMLGIK